MAKVPARIKAMFSSWRWRLMTLLAIVVAIGIASIFLGRRAAEPAALSQPSFGLDQLAGQTWYYNPAAERWVPIHLRNTTRGAEFSRAARDPALWRQLDRELRFDAVFLAGDPAGYRELLRHLRTSRDWALTNLDHVSFVFRRAPAIAWLPAQLPSLEEKFAAFPPHDRAIFQSRLANNLIEIDAATSARVCLDRALGLEDRSPEIWNELAILDAHLSHWTDALAHADRALALKRRYPPAQSVKAQALLGLGRAGEAFEISSELLRSNRDDPSLLYLHARIAHQARAYDAEIATLRHLIELAQRAQQPVGGYLIYLAQAYSAAGQTDLSLAEFTKVRAAAELTTEQRGYVETAIQRLTPRASR